MFVPLTHAPGEAQADFGEALVVVIAGVEQKAHYLAMDLPHSDDCFVHGVSGRDDGGFSGRPCASLRVLRRRSHADSLRQHEDRGGEDSGRRERQKTRAFSELQSYYLFADKFGRPAKGNDKGKVEGLVGYARRNFMVPIPRAAVGKS
jgi:transposase